MTDWKPGDRFTLELEVATSYNDGWVDTIQPFTFSPTQMASAVRLPPEARPVYLTDAKRVAHCGAKANVVTHADGSPIDWTASE